MKKLILALITVLSASSLALSACSPPEDQGVEATTTVTRATATKEATTEITSSVTEDDTEGPEESTIEATERVVGQANKQIEGESVKITLLVVDHQCSRASLCGRRVADAG